MPSRCSTVPFSPATLSSLTKLTRVVGLLGGLSVLLAGCCARGMLHHEEESSKPPVVVAKEPSRPAATPTVAARPTPPPRPAILSVPGKSTRVRFQSGSTGTDMRDAVVRGERNRYLVGAMEGQTMTVTINAPGRNATFVVVGADGRVIGGTEERRAARQWSGLLPAGGDTIISVGGIQGNAEYTLHIDVSARNEAAQCKGEMADSHVSCFLTDGRNGSCENAICKDVCPAGHSYDPTDTRCHQRRDCRSVSITDNNYRKTSQCEQCMYGHCFDDGATRDLL